MHSEMMNILRKLRLNQLILKTLPRSWREFYYLIRREFPLIDNNQVILFASSDIKFDYTPRKTIHEDDLRLRNLKISLITTCLNEEKHIQEWFDSLIKQTRLPDELVIVDGGSRDRTLELIKNFENISPCPIKIIQKPGVNIASGRNIAIKNATYSLIVCTDIGVKLDPNWLLYITVPFEMDSEIQVSYGLTCPLDHNSLYSKYLVQPLETIHPDKFLPSSRNIAFYKSIWEKVGGYPEWLRDAGEDTYFDFLLKKIPAKCAFVPHALVKWLGPTTYYSFIKTIWRYSFGDGETGIFANSYWTKFYNYFALLLKLMIITIIIGFLLLIGVAQWLVIIVILLGVISVLYKLLKKNPTSKKWKGWLTGHIVELIQASGFVIGVANRFSSEQRHVAILENELSLILNKYADVKGVIIYLPTHDWSFMFQRPQQMARAFAKSGYLWFYCTNNEKTDFIASFFEVEERLILCHIPLNTFNTLQNPIVYIGAPFHVKQLDLFNSPFIIYDHYDDLVVSSSRFEDHIQMLQRADMVITTSDRLYQEVSLIRTDTLLVPNGVDYELIASLRSMSFEIPKDMQSIITLNKPIIGYSGALASWLDYNLLEQVAKEQPNYEFVLIGVNYDHSVDQCTLLSLPNVHWLGMKRYEELFKYLLLFDVGIIPFKINQITLSTSPIKLYEYAACQKPIVTTPLPECFKYPEVIIGRTPLEFLDGLNHAMQKSKDNEFKKKLDELAKSNSWINRAQLIINLLNDKQV